MGLQTFAAIYIGTYEVSLKIFELNGKKKLHEVDHVRKRLEIGRDIYRNKSLNYQLVDELCETLLEFSTIMEGYKVKKYEVYATSTLHSADNELFILDQVAQRTGIEVQVLSNSEHRFISYQSVAVRKEFEQIIQSSAAVVDLGGAGMQITIFRKGALVTTQHIVLGTIRIRELLTNRGNSLSLYENQIEEFVNKKLESLRQLYFKEGVEYIVLMGDYSSEVMKRIDKSHQDLNAVKTEKFLKYIQRLQKKTIEEISEELNLADIVDPLIVPAMMIFKALSENFQSENVWVPGVNINDGIAYQYAEKNHLVKRTHDFEADIISAAKNLSEHYHSYSQHIDAMQDLSNRIFDAMKKIHGLGEREKMLLQVATILHDCGKYISFANSPECAFHIIMSSEIIGISHRERQIVAYTVLYNTKELDPYDDLRDTIDQEAYLVIAKLSAILRVANALDQSHKQKFKSLKIVQKGKELNCTVETMEDISLEKALFGDKTAYFERVYSVKPILKERKVYQVE